MVLRRLALLAVEVTACLALVPAAWAGTALPARVGHAMGLVPHFGVQDPAAGSQTPVVYHAGSVMKSPGGVTVHTIFWAPPGYSFHAGYRALIQQFFTDVAHDDGSTTNVFSVLP